MFCWGFIYGGWRLLLSTFGGISLEDGWSNGAGMFEWASVLTGWRCQDFAFSQWMTVIVSQTESTGVEFEKDRLKFYDDCDD